MHRVTDLFLTLSRRGKVALQAMVDCILIALSFAAAMALRLENLHSVSNMISWAVLLVIVPVTIAALYKFGFYNSLIRYITGRILLVVAKGALLSAVALYVCGFLLGANIPRSVPIIHAMFLFLSVGGLRFAARYLFRRSTVSSREPVIIYGAGEAGRQLLNALHHGRSYAPVALVDDDPQLQGLFIGGLRVFPEAKIAKVVEQTGAGVILLAVPSISRARRREIVNSLKDLKVQIKTIPGMSEIINGSAKISDLRSVQPEDLLGRDPVAPDPSLLKHTIFGKAVMVAGAGGSIGSELCRQILSLQPSALVLFEISEYSLYEIDSELNETARQLPYKVKIVPVLGSVRDACRLENAIRSFGVQTIYHTAAYKHVPLVEENVVEGVRNNVFGTLSISSVARKCEVESFTLISTDKAVRPTNIMGATKRIAELICQALAQDSPKTVFSMVRFGNVLGSSGSVIPRFRSQIEKGGPVTVTHRDITRYFMTIPEASQLVIQAGAMAKGGDVFVLDMGKPVKIFNLAMDMVRLHGLVPYEVDHPDEVFPERGDIPVCLTGLRKGEKLYEELLIGNNPLPTQHPRVMTASETAMTDAELMPILDRLQEACDAHDLPVVLQIIRGLPVGYAPLEIGTSDLIWNAGQGEQLKDAPFPRSTTFY